MGRPRKGHRRISVCLPPDIHDQIKAEAKARGKSVSYLVVEAFFHRQIPDHEHNTAPPIDD